MNKVLKGEFEHKACERFADGSIASTRHLFEKWEKNFPNALFSYKECMMADNYDGLYKRTFGKAMIPL